MKPYADSSFLVALYLQQQSTSKAVEFMTRFGKPLPFTPWHRLEVRNAIRVAHHNGIIELAECKSQLKQLDGDLRDETVLVHLGIDWTDVLRKAEHLGSKHNIAIGCRSADLFHIAAALDGGCDTFLTFDSRQGSLAKAAGLEVFAWPNR